MSVRFSILIVALNAGEKLRNTVLSVINQKFDDYEIVIKDGCSTDNSLSEIEELNNPKIKIVVQKDTGIYDAMNQALLCASGEYVYFLNCGDYLYNDNVLEKINTYLNENKLNSDSCKIVYGNILDRLTMQTVPSNPNMDEFGCYRNVPCHQACIYERQMLLKHEFDTSFKVRADYEQFLWCFFVAKAVPHYIDMIIADYEGGGFSETREHLKLSQKEHKQITGKYMSKSSLFKYRLIMIISLSSFRTWLSHNDKTAKLYNGIKDRLYRLKK